MIVHMKAGQDPKQLQGWHPTLCPKPNLQVRWAMDSRSRGSIENGGCPPQSRGAAELFPLSGAPLVPRQCPCTSMVHCCLCYTHPSFPYPPVFPFSDGQASFSEHFSQVWEPNVGISASVSPGFLIILALLPLSFPWFT